MIRPACILALAAAIAGTNDSALLAQDRDLLRVEPTTSPGLWFDYPLRSITNNEQAQIAFRIVVASDGQPESCEITIASSYPNLNEATCAQALRRARFNPVEATLDGPMRRVFESKVTWLIPPELVEGRLASNTDLPPLAADEGGAPGMLAYRLDVDTQGRALSC